MNKRSEIKPIVLPDQIKFKDFKGDRNKYLDNLYEVFRKDFCLNTTLFKGLKVFPLRDPLKDGRMQSFNHIISFGDEEFFRTESFARAEKIPWISTILKSAPHPDLKIWEKVCRSGKKKRKKVRTLIWHEASNFLIILENNNNGYALITAYCTTQKFVKQKLQKEYEHYIKNELPV